MIGPDGAKKSSGIGTSTFNGGTGKFQKIKGLYWGSYTFDAAKGIDTGQWEREYWMDE